MFVTLIHAEMEEYATPMYMVLVMYVLVQLLIQVQSAIFIFNQPIHQLLIRVLLINATMVVPVFLMVIHILASVLSIILELLVKFVRIN